MHLLQSHTTTVSDLKSNFFNKNRECSFLVIGSVLHSLQEFFAFINIFYFFGVEGSCREKTDITSSFLSLKNLVVFIRRGALQSV
jgi:hypothetical protein